MNDQRIKEINQSKRLERSTETLSNHKYLRLKAWSVSKCCKGSFVDNAQKSSKNSKPLSYFIVKCDSFITKCVGTMVFYQKFKSYNVIFDAELIPLVNLTLGSL